MADGQRMTGADVVPPVRVLRIQRLRQLRHRPRHAVIQGRPPRVPHGLQAHCYHCRARVGFGRASRCSSPEGDASDRRGWLPVWRHCQLDVAVVSSDSCFLCDRSERGCRRGACMRASGRVAPRGWRALAWRGLVSRSEQ
jgi:hypothetical protein